MSYDEKTHVCIEALTKSSIMNRDLSMRTRPTFLYDLRVAVANEYEEVRLLSSSERFVANYINSRTSLKRLLLTLLAYEEKSVGHS